MVSAICEVAGSEVKDSPTVCVRSSARLSRIIFNAVCVNPNFGWVEWPGGVYLCPDAMHQAMTGSQSEAELYSAAALREDVKKNE
jgi:hypothetical protein